MHKKHTLLGSEKILSFEIAEFVALAVPGYMSGDREFVDRSTASAALPKNGLGSHAFPWLDLLQTIRTLPPASACAKQSAWKGFQAVMESAASAALLVSGKL